MTKEKYECEFQALICERESYIAENQNRIGNGYTVAYDDEQFLELAERFRVLAKEYEMEAAHE